MQITHIVFFACVFFSVAEAANAESIKQLSYEYQYDSARGLQDDSFLICDHCAYDRPTQAVELSVRMTSLAPSPLGFGEPVQPTNLVVSPRLFESIHFKLDSITLLPEARSKLDQLQTPEGIRLLGYACTLGSTGYNLKLSQRRADVVALYLKRRGISILKATGYGESSTFSGYAKNRRVEISAVAENKETL